MGNEEIFVISSCLGDDSPALLGYCYSHEDAFSYMLESLVGDCKYALDNGIISDNACQFVIDELQIMLASGCKSGHIYDVDLDVSIYICPNYIDYHIFSEESHLSIDTCTRVVSNLDFRTDNREYDVNEEDFIPLF